MTVPRGIKEATQRVSDFVRDLIPQWRKHLSKEDARLAVYLRGNTDLWEALQALIHTRISGRASVPVPSDPIVCKAMLERDRELQWLLSRLEFVYRSAVSQPEQQDDREQPA